MNLGVNWPQFKMKIHQFGGRGRILQSEQPSWACQQNTQQLLRLAQPALWQELPLGSPKSGCVVELKQRGTGTTWNAGASLSSGIVACAGWTTKRWAEGTEGLRVWNTGLLALKVAAFETWGAAYIEVSLAVVRAAKATTTTPTAMQPIAAWLCIVLQ